MRIECGTSIHLDVPFYRQHYDFTCGPASLMMAMEYLDRTLRPGKDMEIDLWREGNLVAFLGTSRYGLAYSAAVRGFSVQVTSNTGGLDFVETFLPSLNDQDLQILKDHFYERRRRCRNLGVRERRETITRETLLSALSSHHVPLLVTNSSYFSQDTLPHWIAGTGIDERFLFFNNPSDARPRKRKIDLSALPEFIGYYGTQSMVEVWKPIQNE